MGVFSQYLDTNVGPVSVHLQQQQQYLTVALDCKMIHICTEHRKPGKLYLHHGSFVQFYYVSCISLIDDIYNIQDKKLLNFLIECIASNSSNIYSIYNMIIMKL